MKEVRIWSYKDSRPLQEIFNEIDEELRKNTGYHLRLDGDRKVFVVYDLRG